MAVAVSHLLPFAAAEFAQPTLDLRMTIEEGKAAGPVVISGRNIAPTVKSAVTVQGCDPVSVVDGIGVFVEQHKQPRRTAPFWIGGFPPSEPGAQPGTIVVGAGEGVHRDASGPLRPSLGALHGTEIDVGGAVINVVGLGGV